MDELIKKLRELASLAWKDQYISQYLPEDDDLSPNEKLDYKRHDRKSIELQIRKGCAAALRHATETGAFINGSEMQLVTVRRLEELARIIEEG